MGRDGGDDLGVVGMSLGECPKAIEITLFAMGAPAPRQAPTAGCGIPWIAWPDCA